MRTVSSSHLQTRMGPWRCRTTQSSSPVMGFISSLWRATSPRSSASGFSTGRVGNLFSPWTWSSLLTLSQWPICVSRTKFTWMWPLRMPPAKTSRWMVGSWFLFIKILVDSVSTEDLMVAPKPGTSMNATLGVDRTLTLPWEWRRCPSSALTFGHVRCDQKQITPTPTQGYLKLVFTYQLTLCIYPMSSKSPSPPHPSRLPQAC